MDVKASFMTYLEQLKRSQSDPSLGKGNPTKAMSCEGCSQKFTVFKRKKLCNICLRYFCTHCLTPQLGPNGNNSVLARLTERRHICATCMVLTARPLCRLQLKRLKVKDLQHYLTAQRVSTRGCVEKDDLVNLLIRHVGSTNSGSHQENICNSHPDLSMGSESNTSNPLRDRPPVPPQLFRTNANSTSNSAQNSSAHRPPPPPPSAAAGVRATVTTSATSATTSSSSGSGARVASSRPATSPANSDEEFEIVELTEDWSGEMDETGPEPVVEEISDSAGGTLSSPTSVGGEQNTLSSSTTSLGEPNVTSSSTSSPSHDHSPSHHSDSGPPTAPPPSSPPSQPPPPPRFSRPSSPQHPLSPHPGVTEVSAEEEGEEADVPMDTSETASTVMPEPAATSTELHSVRPPIITLNTIKTLEELQSMPVKQIKDLLMRNRVDFRGCCERTELVERVTRLWIENREQMKALEREGSAEMCKICMDAPIECAMLECGHMATCMSCGKQLNECPLCRQYVVRVLRIFRA